MPVWRYLKVWRTDFEMLQRRYFGHGADLGLVVDIQLSLDNRGGTHATSSCTRGKKWAERRVSKKWPFLNQNYDHFSQIWSGQKGGQKRWAAVASFFHDTLQLWVQFDNSKTSGRIFLGSNNKLVVSWSEAFPQVSAKYLIGKQLWLHLIIQSFQTIALTEIA
jgi:hypothetical protein